MPLSPEYVRVLHEVKTSKVFQKSDELPKPDEIKTDEQDSPKNAAIQSKNSKPRS